VEIVAAPPNLKDLMALMAGRMVWKNKLEGQRSNRRLAELGIWIVFWLYVFWTGEHHKAGLRMHDNGRSAAQWRGHFVLQLFGPSDRSQCLVTCAGDLKRQMGVI